MPRDPNCSCFLESARRAASLCPARCVDGGVRTSMAFKKEDTMGGKGYVVWGDGRKGEADEFHRLDGQSRSLREAPHGRQHRLGHLGGHVIRKTVVWGN